MSTDVKEYYAITEDPPIITWTKISDIFLDILLFTFALWTLCSNVIVLLGFGLIHLLFLFPSVLLVTCIAWYYSRIGCREIIAVKDNSLVHQKNPKEGRYQSIALFIFIIVAICISLVAHRPDMDDSLYINFAVSAVDSADSPLMKTVNVHSIPGVPLYFPYRMQSIETLAAGISYVFKVPTINVFHLVFPPLVAAVFVLAYGRLFRNTVPDYWIPAFIALFVFLIANGDVHRTYGNFFLTRLQQGKGIFVTLMPPFFLYYGLRCVIAGRKTDWLKFFLVHICSYGLTWSALMVTPFFSILAILSFVKPTVNVQLLKKIAIVLILVVIIVMVGFFIRFSTDDFSKFENHTSNTEVTWDQVFIQLVEKVFGFHVFAITCLIMLLTAWYSAPTPHGRQICLVFPLFIMIFIMNPLSLMIILKFVPSIWTIWRLAWILPMPLIAALWIIAPLRFRGKLSRNILSYAMYWLILFFILCILPQQTILSSELLVSIDFPRLKVPEQYDVARKIDELLSDRENVLVSQEVGLWLPTFHDHSYPILARYEYVALYHVVKGEDISLRKRAQSYIDGRNDINNPQRFLHRLVNHFQIRCFTFHSKMRFAAEITTILPELGFEKNSTMHGYELWLQESKPR